MITTPLQQLIATSMEEDYLSLYEAVDQEANQNDQSKGLNSEYELLKVNDHTVSEQEQYQLLHADAKYVHYREYSDVATELKMLKRTFKYWKRFAIVGVIVVTVLLITVVCVLVGTWVQFGGNLATVQKSLTEKVDHVQQGSSMEHINYLQRNLTDMINMQKSLTEQIDALNVTYHSLKYDEIFRNCSQETESCNFRHEPSNNNWLYCDTPNIKLNKKNHFTIDIRCNHNFDVIQNSLLSSSPVVVSGSNELYCHCTRVHPTNVGHSILPLPDVTPNCILVVTRCPVF